MEEKQLTNPDNIERILKERHPDLFKEDLSEKVGNIEKNLDKLVKENEELKKQLANVNKGNEEV